MTRIYSGSAVPRHFVFILADGSFVVQWDENRVQDILSGKYYRLDEEGFGHAINDYELNQLKAAGRVEHYTRQFVWLYALPEPERFQTPLKTQEKIPDQIRAYYLNTTLPMSQFEQIQSLLEKLGLAQEFRADKRGNLVAIAGRDGAPFLHFKQVEQAQRRLMSQAPDLFKDSAIAFVEMRQSDQQRRQEMVIKPDDNTDLSTLIASQTDVSVTAGKRVVLLIGREGERLSAQELCQEMKINVSLAATGADALRLLEDARPHLLLMDLELPDMHGWAMLGKANEMELLDALSVIVVAEHSAPNHQSFALSVANVEVYLVKPVSKSRLRQNIWMSLKNRSLQ